MVDDPGTLERSLASQHHPAVGFSVSRVEGGLLDGGQHALEVCPQHRVDHGTGQSAHGATPWHIPVVECDRCPIGLEDEPGLGVVERDESGWLIRAGDSAALFPSGDRFNQCADRHQVHLAARTHTVGLVSDGSRGFEAHPLRPR